MMNKIKTPWWIWILSFLTLGYAYLLYIPFKKRKQARLYVNDLINNNYEYTYDEFKKMFDSIKNAKIKFNNIDKPGVYIIHNLNNDKYYIGQSVNVIRRVNNHFSGKGNGDVYADFKYGNTFSIKIINCNKDELNFIEKQAIEKYNSYYNGYNKNKGIGPGYKLNH